MKTTFRDYVKRIFFKLKRHYLILLVLIVFTSYGQILGMNVWEDDQALFFKLAHISKPAGYFGSGPLGEGVYKYAATPFIPIYYFFGFNTVAYFGYLLLLYIITTVVVYKTYSLILGKAGGRIAGFLYAAGYVTSDGFWRMTNSVITSISIILTCLIFFCYWKFFKNKSFFWYLAALMLYFILLEVAKARVHYFVVIILSFELFFLAFVKPFRSIIYSLARLLPFLYIFYYKYFLSWDQRAGGVKDTLFAILRGEFYQLYGFLGSLANISLPDWLINYIYIFQDWTDHVTKTNRPWLTLVIIPTLYCYFIFRKQLKGKLLVPFYFVFSIIWIYISKNIFSTPILHLDKAGYFLGSLGGIVLVFVLVIFFALNKNRRLYLLLIIWLLSNIAAYSAYFPTVAYETFNRYLAHSFVAWCGVFGLIFITLPKKRFTVQIAVVAIILIGLGNIFHAVVYEKNILTSRSYPSKQFYKNLKSYLPIVEKGSIFYIDVATDTQSQIRYDDIISAATMPNTTSLAWRYGIDRYDIELTNDFTQLMTIIKNQKIPQKNIHTFFYSKDKLLDTTSDVDAYLNKTLNNDFYTLLPQSSVAKINLVDTGSLFSQPELIIDIDKPVKSMVPLKLTLGISSSPIKTEEIKYPLFDDINILKDTKSVWRDTNFKTLAFEYNKAKSEFYKSSQIKTSSQWQDRFTKNLQDQEVSTVWQSNRSTWGHEKTFIEIKLKEIEKISRLIWINGFADHTPTNYSIETSIDGEFWQQVKVVNDLKRINDIFLQIEDFSPVDALFIRFVINATVGGDSPSLAEIWPVKTHFKDLDINKAEELIKKPYAYIADAIDYNNVYNSSNKSGNVLLSWQSDKQTSWQSLKQTELTVVYDSLEHEYTIELPPGGTNIYKLKFSNFTTPGIFNLNSVKVEYVGF